MEIKKAGIENNIYENIQYIPNNEVYKYFTAADIVAHPYHEISQSGVLQIALAFGKPVIATLVGGFPEIIEDGKSSFLVPTNRPDILSQRINRIFKNDELLSNIEQNALAISKQYSWDKIAKQTANLYKCLV